MNKQEKLNLIQEIKNNLDKLAKSILEENVGLQHEGGMLVESITQKKEEPLYVADNSEQEFEELKKLLYSEEWPEAVLEFQIVDRQFEEEKMDRAEGVVDILVTESLENKKFLDFGCGEGHMAKYASKEASFAVGYDIKKPENATWENKEEKLLLTTDLEKVKQEGPYDIIMIYDVLDHMQGSGQILDQAKNLLSDGGKIYLRCHPWCGRHGGHLYRQLNKAFVHVVFSDEELEKLGLKQEEETHKIKFPIMEYSKMIQAANLKVENKEPDIEKQKHEDFFEKNKIVSARLKKVISAEGGKLFPAHQISQCFLDYVLKR